MRSSSRSAVCSVLCALLFCAVSTGAQTISVTNWATAVSSGQVILSGDASVSGSTLVMTPDLFDKKGAAFFADPVDVSEDFDVSFTYNTNSVSGCANAADGIVLTFQPYSPTYFGIAGIWLGLDPNTRFFGIFVDAYGNGAGVGDAEGGPGVWHVGLSRSYQVYWKWQMGTSSDFCARGTPATVRATYIQNQLTIYVNGQIYQTLNSTLSLASLIGQRSAYLGFTAGTGALRMRQEVTSFTYTVSSSNVCAAKFSCSDCTAAQCFWCNGTCALRASNTTSCARTCALPSSQAPVAPPPPPVSPPVQAPVADMCTLRTNCGSCTADNLCTWSTAVNRNGLCSARKRTDVVNTRTFLTPLQCQAVCALETTCGDCATKSAWGCGWCADPAKGKPVCLLNSYSNLCTSPLINAPCHDMDACKLSILNPSITASTIQGTLRVNYAYSGPGGVAHDWNVTSIYRNRTGTVSPRQTVVSTATRTIPSFNPAAKFKSISFDQLISVPIDTNGTPELTVELTPNNFRASSGFKRCILSVPLVSFPKTDPGVSLAVSPGSAYINRMIDFKIRPKLKDTNPPSLWQLTRASFTWLGNPIAVTFDGTRYRFSIRADAITAVGQYPIGAVLSFNTPLGPRNRTVSYSVGFMDASRLIADKSMFAQGQIMEEPDEDGLTFSGGWFLTMGTAEDAQLPFNVEGKFKFLIEMALNYGFSSRGLGSARFDASISVELSDILEGAGGAQLSFLYTKEKGVWTPRQRTFAGFVELARIFALPDKKLPSFMRKRLSVELKVGGGLRAFIMWKNVPYNDDCWGGSGQWRRCRPVSIVPYFFAIASAKVGGRWAGAEAYGAIEMSATINIAPFGFGGLGFNFKVGIRVWALFFSLRLEYSRSFCFIGDGCRKRAFDDGESDPIYGIPLKLINAGVFYDTPRPSNAAEYIALDERIDSFSIPVLRSTSLSRDFAMAVYSYRPANDSRPQNPRLRAVWVESPADGDIRFSAPADISELLNNNFADSSPALAWLPKTDREYILVWTRDTNASWVHTAPVVDGEIPCTPTQVRSAMQSSQLQWAYFRPGRGWQIRGSLTTGSTFSTGAQLSDSNLIHPVNQPILVAYEESQPWITGADVTFNNTFIRIRKFDASSIEMSSAAALSWPLEDTPQGLIVRSYGRSHMLAYLIKDEDDINQPFARFVEWDTTAASPSTPSIQSLSGVNGIALPSCPNGASASNIFASAWPRNLQTESFDPSDLRFLVGYNCERSLFVGFVDSTVPFLPSFQRLSVNMTADVSAVSYSHNGTHLTFLWYGREVDTKKSSYYTKTLAFAENAPWPPTFDMFNNAPFIRRVRTTAQEEAFSAVYMQGPFLATLSSDNLFDKNANDLKDNETAVVVTRRLIGGVVDMTLPNQPIHTVSCTDALLMVSADGIEGSWIRANCTSTFAGPVDFEVRHGVSYSEDNVVGSDQKTLFVGRNDIMVRVDIRDLNGGSLALVPSSPEVSITAPARAAFPIPATDLAFVAESSVQVGTSSPVQINTVVTNLGMLPSGFIIRAYSESHNGALVGEIADRDVLSLNNQRSKSLLLWGIQAEGDYTVRLALYESEDDTFPAATQLVEVFVAPQEALDLPLSSVAAELGLGQVSVNVPAGSFSPQSIRLVDLSANQEVDSVRVEDFSTSQSLSLRTQGRSGPFAVVVGPHYASSDAEQLSSRLTFIPVRPSRFVPVFNQNGANRLRVSEPRAVLASNTSAERFVLQVPRVSSPWGVVVAATPSVGEADFTVSVSEFVPGSLPSGAIRSQRLGSSKTFATFTPFGSLNIPPFLHVAAAVTTNNTELRTSASLAQFIAISNSTVQTYTLDSAAPVFLNVRASTSGDLRLSLDRDYSATRVYSSTTNFVLGANQGGSEVRRTVSRTFTSLTTTSEDEATGALNSTTTATPRVRTSWSVPVVAGNTYYISFLSSGVGGGVFSLNVDSSSLSVLKTSSCSISPLSSDREPSATIIHHQATNFTEIQVLLADEDVESDSARLDDVVVTFDGPAGHCNFRLRDPLMSTLWTVAPVQTSSGCRKLLYSQILPIDTILQCLNPDAGAEGVFTGSIQVERTYLIPPSLAGTGIVKRSTDGETYSSYSTTSTVSLQVLQPPAPVAPPVDPPMDPPVDPPVQPPVEPPVLEQPYP